MKKILLLIITTVVFTSCFNKKTSKVSENKTNKLIGTWKLVYGEIKENDSIQIRDISKSDFIKIINKTHFAFFNQRKGTSESFYGGAGTYVLEESSYVEKLDYIDNVGFRNHTFTFNVEFKGDTLIQSGVEELKELKINRFIVEKYIRIH